MWWTWDLSWENPNWRSILGPLRPVWGDENRALLGRPLDISSARKCGCTCLVPTVALATVQAHHTRHCEPYQPNVELEGQDCGTGLPEWRKKTNVSLFKSPSADVRWVRGEPCDPPLGHFLLSLFFRTQEGTGVKALKRHFAGNVLKCFEIFTSPSELISKYKLPPC